MKKILICDDSIAEVKLMQTVLERAGYFSVAINDATQIERTIELCKRALRDAKLNASELERLILVGGSTRMPLVRKDGKLCGPGTLDKNHSGCAF